LNQPGTTSTNNPLIIAHRGTSLIAPENTLAAFALAIESGADGIELDVRLSRDGVPVVIHDATLQRTGLRSEAVATLSAEHLATVDVGS
jgi:glycerophosphoryl diester phosphodiesterase